MRSTKTLMLSMLIASAVAGAALSPASANWFSRPGANINLNVGSAPSPTPEQLRAVGDSHYAPNTYRGRVENLPPPALSQFEGRRVFGARGAQLGYVLAVNEETQRVDLQTPSGIAVSLPADLLSDNGSRITAPTISRADIRDMARDQTGRTVALNTDE